MVADFIADFTAIQLVAREAGVRDDLMERGRIVARRAQTAAPKLTGAGAASIATEAVLTAAGWCCDISWDRAHGYMRFTDMGTRYIQAQHYLEQALQGGV